MRNGKRNEMKDVEKNNFKKFTVKDAHKNVSFHKYAERTTISQTSQSAIKNILQKFP